MRRVLLLSLVIPLAIASALVISACGGGDDDDPPATTRSATPNGGGVTPPPAAGGSADPVVSCMASKGFTVDSPDDITTPEAQQALSECLGGLHGGGGVP
jgi:hypothetical protein